MNIRFLKSAQKELDNAVDWNEQKSLNLGLRFIREVNISLKRIVAYPDSCAEIEENI